jgi:hypothetical protein
MPVSQGWVWRKRRDHRDVPTRCGPSPAGRARMGGYDGAKKAHCDLCTVGVRLTGRIEHRPVAPGECHTRTRRRARWSNGERQMDESGMQIGIPTESSRPGLTAGPGGFQSLVRKIIAEFRCGGISEVIQSRCMTRSPRRESCLLLGDWRWA